MIQRSLHLRLGNAKLDEEVGVVAAEGDGLIPRFGGEFAHCGRASDAMHGDGQGFEGIPAILRGHINFQVLEHAAWSLAADGLSFDFRWRVGGGTVEDASHDDACLFRRPANARARCALLVWSRFERSGGCGAPAGA